MNWGAIRIDRGIHSEGIVRLANVSLRRRCPPRYEQAICAGSDTVSFLRSLLCARACWSARLRRMKSFVEHFLHLGAPLLSEAGASGPTVAFRTACLHAACRPVQATTIRDSSSHYDGLNCCIAGISGRDRLRRGGVSRRRRRAAACPRSGSRPAGPSSGTPDRW